MNIHVKLFLPTLMLLLTIAGTIHFYWVPGFLKVEIEKQRSNEHVFIELLVTALIPDLLNNDISKVHTSLNDVLTSRKYWHAIKLFDDKHERIYPLFETEASGDGFELFEHDIVLTET